MAKPSSSEADLRAVSLPRYVLLILAIILLAFAARFIHLGGDSFWFDEVFTLDTARQSLGHVLAGQDINNPPGFHLLAFFSVQVWGTSEYALRLVSAVAGTLTVPLMFVVGSLLSNRRVGLWAALLLAVSPFHVRYSQEARAYAVQAALTTASAACLLLAIARRKRWWIGFGIATASNAYVQFGSFVVLAGQIAFVGLLATTHRLLKQWTIRRSVEVAVGLALGSVVALILYSPWIGPALQGVAANMGSGAANGAWSNVSIGDRISAAYFAFGFMNAELAAVVGLLCLIGIGSAVLKREVDQVLWILTSLALPFVLIAVAGISRAPLPKHVLFLLPVYLAASAIGLDALVEATARWLATRSRSAARLAPFAVTAGLLLVGIPSVRAEHAYIYNDWKGIAQYLKVTAREGDVVVPITLDLPDSFNQGYGVLSHYLPEELPTARLLIGEQLADPSNDLPALAQSSGDVWFTLLNRVRPIQLDDPSIRVIPFQESIYLVHAPAAGRSPLEQMVALYPKIIPLALTPAPQCYLWLDLAVLHIELGRYDDARDAMSNFQTPCPDTLAARQGVYLRLLAHYRQTQQTDRAREVALRLVELDSKDAAALDALSVFDLAAMFETGQAQVVESPALPVKRARFTMPQNGDWGEVVLMQTPAQLTYRLALPAEPVEFRSRIALAPESWNWGGDGSTFSARIEDGFRNQAVLFEQHVSSAESDRRWHDVSLSLGQYAGQTIMLTLVTDPGPAGDTTGDWAGWDSPRIVYARVE